MGQQVLVADDDNGPDDDMNAQVLGCVNGCPATHTYMVMLNKQESDCGCFTLQSIILPVFA